MINLIRLIIISLIIWLVIRLVKNFLNQTSKPTSKSSDNKLDNMVRCDHCGLHIPEHEAFQEHDKFFCSAEHRQLGKQDQD